MTNEANEILAKLAELAGIDKYDSDQKQTIEVLYEKVLKKAFMRTGCPDCYHDAVVEAMAYLKKHGDVKPEQKYELKYGEYFFLGGFGSADMYTRKTMTDEKAIAYLAETNGNGADKFMKLPENWEEEVEAYKASATEEATETSEATEETAEEATEEAKEKTSKKKK